MSGYDGKIGDKVEGKLKFQLASKQERWTKLFVVVRPGAVSVAGRELLTQGVPKPYTVPSLHCDS